MCEEGVVVELAEEGVEEDVVVEGGGGGDVHVCFVCHNR